MKGGKYLTQHNRERPSPSCQAASGVSLRAPKIRSNHRAMVPLPGGGLLPVHTALCKHLKKDLKQIQAERDSIWHERKRTVGLNRNPFLKMSLSSLWILQGVSPSSPWLVPPPGFDELSTTQRKCGRTRNRVLPVPFPWFLFPFSLYLIHSHPPRLAVSARLILSVHSPRLSAKGCRSNLSLPTHDQCLFLLSPLGLGHVTLEGPSPEGCMQYR